MNEQQQTRALYNGFGDTLARAFELVVTPVVCGVIGHLIDRWLNTGFVFAMVLVILAVVAISIRMFYGYAEDMKAHESEGAWGRREKSA